MVISINISVTGLNYRSVLFVHTGCFGMDLRKSQSFIKGERDDPSDIIHHHSSHSSIFNWALLAQLIAQKAWNCRAQAPFHTCWVKQAPNLWPARAYTITRQIEQLLYLLPTFSLSQVSVSWLLLSLPLGSHCHLMPPLLAATFFLPFSWQTIHSQRHKGTWQSDQLHSTSTCSVIFFSLPMEPEGMKMLQLGSQM